MRSPRGLLAALILFGTVPAGIAVAIATGGGAEPVVHFGIGTAVVLLALAAFDFGLPRAVAWFGALAAGAFGGIFLLQGVDDMVANPALHELAFERLGHLPERILPDLLAGWFALAVLYGSAGRTRILGIVLVGGVIVWELITLVGPALGIAVPDIKLRWLLPFVWLLIASAAHPREADAARPPLEAVARAA